MLELRNAAAGGNPFGLLFRTLTLFWKRQGMHLKPFDAGGDDARYVERRTRCCAACAGNVNDGGMLDIETPADDDTCVECDIAYGVMP